MNTVEFEGKEIAVLTYHLTSMKKSVKKLFKSTGKEWKEQFMKYDTIIKKLLAPKKLAEDQFSLNFTESEKEMLASFLRDYMKKLKDDLPKRLDKKQRDQMRLLQDAYQKIAFN